MRSGDDPPPRVHEAPCRLSCSRTAGHAPFEGVCQGVSLRDGRLCKAGRGRYFDRVYVIRDMEGACALVSEVQGPQHCAEGRVVEAAVFNNPITMGDLPLLVSSLGAFPGDVGPHRSLELTRPADQIGRRFPNGSAVTPSVVTTGRIESSWAADQDVTRVSATKQANAAATAAAATRPRAGQPELRAPVAGAAVEVAVGPVVARRPAPRGCPGGPGRRARRSAALVAGPGQVPVAQARDELVAQDRLDGGPADHHSRRSWWAAQTMASAATSGW